MPKPSLCFCWCGAHWPLRLTAKPPHARRKPFVVHRYQSWQPQQLQVVKGSEWCKRCALALPPATLTSAAYICVAIRYTTRTRSSSTLSELPGQPTLPLALRSLVGCDQLVRYDNAACNTTDAQHKLATRRRRRRRRCGCSCSLYPRSSWPASRRGAVCRLPLVSCRTKQPRSPCHPP